MTAEHPDHVSPKWGPTTKQVVALTCLGCTNRQIAARLHLSPETIKTHLRHAQRKFGVASKAELRLWLASWDFRDWK
jgi:DNA-binding CsgD family transcriptional regulator